MWCSPLSSVPGRGHAERPAKDLAKVAGAGEAGGIGHTGYGELGLEQEPLGPLRSNALELLVNRPADHLAEPFFQAAPRDQRVPDQVADRNRLTHVVVQKMERGGNFGVAKGDDVGGAPSHHLKRFNKQPARLVAQM